MIIIVFQIVFGLSILGILFIVFRKIPSLLEYERTGSEKVLIYKNLQERWKKVKEKAEASEFLHEAIILKTEKVLRKTKIILLKLDNFLAKRADRLKERVKKRKRENRE